MFKAETSFLLFLTKVWIKVLKEPFLLLNKLVCLLVHELTGEVIEWNCDIMDQRVCEAKLSIIVHKALIFR